jgi:leucyl/phenylalanyl-tRNA--protein transferase
MDDLPPDLLIKAYSQGVFPMANDWDGYIYWYKPERRAVLPFKRLHISRSLERLLRRNLYRVAINEQFEAVMRACAAPAPGREETWINESMIRSYGALHHLGFAHSVEVYDGETLVGGLYGLTVGGLFAGESMFSRVPSASKIALVRLVERLQERGFTLLDMQYMTPHLKTMGGVEVSRAKYDLLLADALQVDARFD